MPQIITSLATLRAQIAQWRQFHKRIAFVPTMGALHAGHMALVRAAKAHADYVVASIFVNPMQFSAHEDLGRYPRTLDADCVLLEAHGADIIWLPSTEQMYPKGFASRVEVQGVSEGLCGAFRPGHFTGVATVVAKLLNQVQPDSAWFGEKDYQQLCVIRRMAEDLNFPIEICSAATVREVDGLALSSRNAYLSEEERNIAPTLYATLCKAAKEMKHAEAEHVITQAIDTLQKAGFRSVEYLELREEETLAPLHTYAPHARLLVAAWLGNTRLIDNIAL